MAKKIDVENMTPEEMKAYIEGSLAKSSEYARNWYMEHKDRRREYQRKYTKTLKYARMQAAYWANKVREMEAAERGEDE